VPASGSRYFGIDRYELSGSGQEHALAALPGRCAQPQARRVASSWLIAGDEQITLLARRRRELYTVIAMKEAIPATRPRGRPREFDRDQALERAMLLFWCRGYEATSISDLTAAMGITPPALYGAFGDKKSLFLEAVGRYERAAGCFAQKALTEEPTAERAIRSLLLGAVEAFANPKKPKGCLVVLGATNCTVESTDIFEALAERRRGAEKFVRARIAAGQKAGELSDSADVDALTGMVTATLYGLAIKARDGAPRARLRSIVEQLMMLWPRNLSPPNGR
jgi:TetR/AcrR family transcriptional regulator, copper-responsive repressor